MRVKDEVKQEALFDATVKLVNEIGFASSSVSKIAKEAGISPATIYIYFKNKEDLLVSTYIEIKKSLSRALLKGFDETVPVRDSLQTIWNNTFEFAENHRDWFEFMEQFSNSPYAALVDKQKVEKHYKPLMKLLQRGIDQKIIKNVPFDILAAFLFYPAMVLSNPRLCTGFERDRKGIETAFALAWDALKL